MSVEEEARAAAFRAQEAARVRSLSARRRALAGDPSAIAGLRARTRALIDPQPVTAEPIVTNDPPTNADD